MFSRTYVLTSCSPFESRTTCTGPRERLLRDLQFELWIGDAAEIRTKRVRKQKTDRQDAQTSTSLRSLVMPYK
jgi:hypothetical protein